MAAIDTTTSMVLNDLYADSGVGFHVSVPEEAVKLIFGEVLTDDVRSHAPPDQTRRSLALRSFAHSPVLDVPVHGRVLGRRRRSGVSERRGPGAGRRAPSVRSAGHVPDMAEGANGWRSRSRSRSTRWCHRDDVLERERENRKRRTPTSCDLDMHYPTCLSRNRSSVR